MKKGKFLNLLSLKQAELVKMKKGEEKDLTLLEKNLLWVLQQELLQELELKKKVLQ